MKSKNEPLFSENELKIQEFKKTLEVAKKYFSRAFSEKYKICGNKKKIMKIVWSDNTVKSILEECKSAEKHVAALNFADGYTPGGLVWQGVKTQEEDLCRSSNLYLSLVGSEATYPIEGELLYSKDVVFFRDDNLNWLHVKDVAVCDIISCPAPICSIVGAKERMEMIISAAMGHDVDVLILGKWGCGAFGNDWCVYKELWEEVLGEEIHYG